MDEKGPLSKPDTLRGGLHGGPYTLRGPQSPRGGGAEPKNSREQVKVGSHVLPQSSLD